MGFLNRVGFFMIILGLILRLTVDYFPSILPFSQGPSVIVSVLMILIGAFLAVSGPKRQMIPA